MNALAAARLLAQEQRGLEPERTRELEAAHSSQRVTGRLVGFERLGEDARGLVDVVNARVREVLGLSPVAS